MNILITQVSKMGALCWIKCLKRITGIKIFIYGTDINPKGFSAGSLLVDEFINIPFSPLSKKYTTTIFNLCRKLKIDLLLTALDNEIKSFLDSDYEFNRYMYNMDYNCFSTFFNKYNATLKMKELGITVPRIINNPFGEKKVIIRDKTSMGSRGIYIIDLEKEKYIENRFQHNRFMQEYISGDEYTVDVLTNKSCEPILIVPRKRIEIRQGISFICQIVKDNEMIDICKKIYSTYKIPGITNVQFIKNKSGIHFIELNPRIGGTSIATVIAGFNFTELFLSHYYKNKSVKNLDYYQDLIAWNSIISRDYNEYIHMP